ncbi:MAG: hypothetical protein Q8N96_05915 [Methylovulum sp.]|nr:hypothetical protein [Methylovulum sp.]
MKTMLPILFVLFAVGAADATEHHSGHGAVTGGGGAGGGGCMKPHLTKFLPAHLETVVPGAGFSFIALNVNKPEQISVTVKTIPVALTTEFKDPYYLVKGKLPESLVNTVARINIKVSAKSPHCEAENGWLLKIADK